MTRARAASILLLGALLAGCGKSATKTTPPVTTGAATRSLQVYYLRGNALAPVTVSVAPTQAVATAALQKLLGGAPPPGYRTAIPPGTQLQSVAVSGGRATVRFSSERLTHSAEGQIVYTLTQFPTVRAVDGGPFDAPASRSAFADLTPQSPIFVAEPQRDSAAWSPVHAHGTADVFEGTLAVDVWSGGRRVRTQTIQATSGTGTRGTWSATIAVPPGPAKLVFYEPSAENGQPLHATSVLLTVH